MRSLHLFSKESPLLTYSFWAKVSSHIEKDLLSLWTFLNLVAAFFTGIFLYLLDFPKFKSSFEMVKGPVYIFFIVHFFTVLPTYFFFLFVFIKPLSKSLLYLWGISLLSLIFVLMV